MQKGEIGVYLSSSIEPAFSPHSSSAVPASPLSASVFGFQMWCERSILSDPGSYFVSSSRLHADGISLPHPPSYIKFATGPL